jgi:hypothetical protein
VTNPSIGQGQAYASRSAAAFPANPSALLPCAAILRTVVTQASKSIQKLK